ncbi:MAG: CYTH domain-containing protein [Actinobacteria bacterium]|nr:CYTH domain-containing protein [Actinomycetota bacterium]
MEIERKFLVDELPLEVRAGEWVTMRQGYLASAEGDAVRIRDTGGVFTLTAKSGYGMMRGEYEIGLTPGQFETLWPGTNGRRVEKSRCSIDADGFRIDVDVFASTLAGLIIAEAEFTTLEQALAFVPPAWFGTEVTEDHLYSNASLAAFGWPRRGPVGSDDVR